MSCLARGSRLCFASTCRSCLTAVFLRDIWNCKQLLLVFWRNNTFPEVYPAGKGAAMKGEWTGRDLVSMETKKRNLKEVLRGKRGTRETGRWDEEGCVGMTDHGCDRRPGSPWVALVYSGLRNPPTPACRSPRPPVTKYEDLTCQRVTLHSRDQGRYAQQAPAAAYASKPLQTDCAAGEYTSRLHGDDSLTAKKTTKAGKGRPTTMIEGASSLWIIEEAAPLIAIENQQLINTQVRHRKSPF